MTDFMNKEKLDQFSKTEFLNFVRAISQVQTKNDDELDSWVRHFDKVSLHPAGRDLIFWPEEGADSSPEGIVSEIERHCRETNLPCFTQGDT